MKRFLIGAASAGILGSILLHFGFCPLLYWTVGISSAILMWCFINE